MSATIEEAINTIKTADGYAGSRRADILQQAIKTLSHSYASELREMGYSKSEAAAQVVETAMEVVQESATDSIKITSDTIAHP